MIALFVRKTIKENQKRRLEEQKRIADEQRMAELRNVGENISTTVRFADEQSMRTEGRHLDTSKLLSFTGVRVQGQKQYSIGDVVFVLVDLNNPGNYKIHWEDELELPALAERVDEPLLSEQPASTDTEPLGA